MADKTYLHLSRPLSPHLQIYKPQWTSVLSIMHRFTGVGLVVGFIGFVIFLVCAAQGSDFYKIFQSMMTSSIGKLFGLGSAGAFFYHMLNGLRHLCWDRGYGFKIKTAESSGKLVVVFSLMLTLFFGIWLWN